MQDYHFINRSCLSSCLLPSKGFVSKLDEFIHWLNEAMETTENWTPPKAETDSLKLYLETHLVRQHCAVVDVSNGNNLTNFYFYFYLYSFLVRK